MIGLHLHPECLNLPVHEGRHPTPQNLSTALTFLVSQLLTECADLEQLT
jgi:hypothetical protein